MDFLLTPYGDITFELYEKENNPLSNMNFDYGKSMEVEEIEEDPKEDIEEDLEEDDVK